MKLTSSRNTPRALEFRKMPTGCWIVVSHKTNPDGYFRYNLGGRINGKPKMFHRIIWSMHHGPIPEGYEINHKCHNRGCCNIEHLECLPRSEHLVMTNQQRWLAPSGKLMKPKKDSFDYGTH